MTFHVTFTEAEDGPVVVECPVLPGCVSQGRTEEEAPRNIEGAIMAWLWTKDQEAIFSLASPRAHRSDRPTVFAAPS